MYISKSKGIVNLYDYISVYKNKGIEIFLNGVVYVPGRKEGAESIEYFLELYRKESRFCFECLRGAYSLVIVQENRVIVFGDNSCMKGFFVSYDAVGSNFEEMVVRKDNLQIDEMGICEYLTLIRGGFSAKTYIEGIEHSDYRKYYLFENGEVYINEKMIREIDDYTDIVDFDVDHFFRDVEYAFSNKKVVCALTGGYDSRLVSTMMNRNVSVDTFVSGDNLASSEIKYAQMVAEAGKYNFRILDTNYVDVTDEYIVEHIKENGSYCVQMGTGDMRIDSFMRQLKKEGYELLLDGNAGDMHKSFWFTQEFPFFLKKRTDYKKFYRMRMESVPTCLGSYVRDSLQEMKEYEYSKMKQLISEYAWESCMKFGWYSDWYNMVAKNANRVCPQIYSPLQEIDLVRYSFKMGYKGKKMNKFFRKYISEGNIDVARVKTIYGTTASVELKYLLKDYFAQGLRYGIQMVRYVIRKFFRKSLFISNVNSRNIEQEVRETNIAKQAVEWAKRENLVEKYVRVETIPFVLLERIMNVYYIFIQKEEKKEV